MKKLLLALFLMFSVFTFAEKFHSDGKTNLEKLKGTWESELIEIIKKGNKWYVEPLSPEFDDRAEIKKYKNGALIANLNCGGSSCPIIFGWDTKYKVFVRLDKNLNIINKAFRYVPCLHNNTCQ